jgi:ribosome biogenesis protein MAK21
MAKNKGKRPAGAEPAIANGDTTGKSTSDESFPSLDESALANLTQNIAQKLQSATGASKGSQKKPNNSPSNAKKSKNSIQQSKSGQKAHQGKKRDRNGEVIAREGEEGKNKPSKPHSDSKNDALRQEILALGGSKDDFDLLADVDSESEVEDSANGTKGQQDEGLLRKELAKLLKDAGHIEPDVIEEEEPEEEEEDNDDAAEDEGENGGVEIEDLEESISDAEETAPSPPAKAPKDTSRNESSAKKDLGQTQGDALPKAYSKLVGLLVPVDIWTLD